MIFFLAIFVGLFVGSILLTYYLKPDTFTTQILPDYEIPGMARITASGGIKINFGFKTITRESTGVYKYTFLTPLPSSDYIVNVQLYEEAIRSDVNNWITETTSSGFIVSLASGDNGGSADEPYDAGHSAVVFNIPSGYSNFDKLGSESVVNSSLFVDENDNVLKFKDSTGNIKTVLTQE